jgi:hypothetical protein
VCFDHEASSRQNFNLTDGFTPEVKWLTAPIKDFYRRKNHA